MDNDRILYKDESFKIIGACFEVYNHMGSGFLESVYQECLERELKLQGIPFKSQADLRLKYKDIDLLHKFRADLVCYDKIIVEIKAVAKIASEHQAQILHYLKTTKLKLGLIINFGSHPKLESKRIVV